jgi:ElaB/YqjD/DUF883 family membrane-anchored ribosome-binding protein
VPRGCRSFEPVARFLHRLCSEQELEENNTVSTTPNAADAQAEGFDDLRDEPAPRTERLAERAHESIEGAAETAAHAEREIRRAATEAAERFRRSEAEVAELLDQNLRRVRDYIEKNPVQSAAIAFAAGVVLSSLLRR